MALAPLSPFVAALVALGLAALLTLLTLALVSFLSNAPYIGGWVANKAVAAEHAISHALGQAFQGVDGFIGGTLHTLARFMDHLWRGYATTAQALLHTAEALARLTGAVAAARALSHTATRLLHGIDRLQRTLEREFHGIEHRVKRLEHDLAHGIGHDVLPRLRSLDRRLDRLTHRTIPAIRQAEAEAAAEIDSLYEWAKGKASLLGVGTFVTAVALALSKLGLDWLKCSNAKSLFGRRGCGLWNDLEGLLGLFADTVLLTNVCTILPFLETAVSEIADPVVVALTDVGAGLCSGGVGAPPTLRVPALSLPGSPAIILNLP